MYPPPLILVLATRLFSLDTFLFCFVCLFVFSREFNNLGPFDNGAEKLQVVQCLVFLFKCFNQRTFF